MAKRKPKVTNNEFVVTQKEKEESQIEEKKPEGKKSPAVEKVVLGAEYFLECAPLGVSTTAFMYDDERFDIELDDGKYKMPKDFKKDQVEKYRKALLANGFVDVTKIDVEKVNIDNGVMKYRFVHPEQTQDNDLNGEIIFNVLNNDGKVIKKDGKPILEKITMKHGIVETDKEGIFKTLQNSGFRLLKKESKIEQ